MDVKQAYYPNLVILKLGINQIQRISRRDCMDLECLGLRGHLEALEKAKEVKIINSCRKGIENGLQVLLGL